MNDIIFKNISIEDGEIIELYLSKYKSLCISFFSFSSLMAWKNVYKYQWAISENTLLLKFFNLEEGREYLMQPIGEFPMSLQNKVIEYARSLDYKLKIYGVSDLFIDIFTEFISNFEQAEHRDMDNYVYLAEDLASLNGGKYQPKRNLIKQFETNNDWKAESISIENILACFEVINKIYNKKELDRDSSIFQELESLDFILNNFIKLKQRGVLIRIDGEPVAFSIYGQLSSSMAAVHYEKAIKEYKGLYQIINRETSKKILQDGYKYINREEDLGIEGLRKAKLSYYPVKMCPAHVLVFKKNAK